MSNNLLQEAMSSSQTFAEFVSSNDMPQKGIVQIESEIIKYEVSSDFGIAVLTRGYSGSTAATHAKSKAVEFIAELVDGDESARSIEYSEVYGDENSHQTVAADLELVAGAGTSASDDTSFLAPFMGHVMGADLTETHNYIAGVIGANTVTGTKSSDLPVAAILGIAMDGVTELDGIVVALIDGSDPSAVTRANAAFKARQLNDNAGSGVDFGLDLHDVAVSGLLSNPTLPLAIAKADIRMSNQVCILNGAGVPSDGTTGDNFAEKGSLYIDTTNGKLYVQGGAITSPAWKIVTSA